MTPDLTATFREREDDQFTVETANSAADGLENIDVADDGAGIPDEERDEIFEAGYSTADDGSGFGLAIVGEIVGAHCWETRVTDSEMGGARFEITDVETAH